jgi:3-hydroxyacyl-CoA dehydrogenase
MSDVDFEVSGAVAVLPLDSPPVHRLVHGLRRSTVNALEHAEDDPAVRAVVLLGSGRTSRRRSYP